MESYQPIKLLKDTILCLQRLKGRVVFITWSQVPAQLLKDWETFHVCIIQSLLRLTEFICLLVDLSFLLLLFLLLPLQEHCTILQMSYVILKLLLFWQQQLLLLRFKQLSYLAALPLLFLLLLMTLQLHKAFMQLHPVISLLFFSPLRQKARQMK